MLCRLPVELAMKPRAWSAELRGESSDASRNREGRLPGAERDWVGGCGERGRSCRAVLARRTPRCMPPDHDARTLGCMYPIIPFSLEGCVFDICVKRRIKATAPPPVTPTTLTAGSFGASEDDDDDDDGDNTDTGDEDDDAAGDDGDDNCGLLEARRERRERHDAAGDDGGEDDADDGDDDDDDDDEDDDDDGADAEDTCGCECRSDRASPKYARSPSLSSSAM